MTAILLVVHVLVILALIGVVLMQKSEGGALGIGGGGGGGMSGFMTGRSTANLLTRATAILAAVFMVLSVALVWLSNQHPSARSILNTRTTGAPALPALPGSKMPAIPGSAIPGSKMPAMPPVPGAKLPAAPAPPSPGPAAPGVPPKD